MESRSLWLILSVAIGAPIACAQAQDSSPRLVTIYNFTDLGAGADINAGLTAGPGGVLYGTSEVGGLLTSPCTALGCGTVLQLTPPSTAGGRWKETVLYRFGSQENDGSSPSTGVTPGANGVLYGTTADGGGSGSHGTVFQLTPPASAGGSWTETIIHEFSAAGDGNLPWGTLALDSSGVLYGTTNAGGTSGLGAVFALQPPSTAGGAWTESVLHSFTGPPDDGQFPFGSVAIGPGGVLFGTTEIGGAGYNGAVYELVPPAKGGGAWTEEILHSFEVGTGDGYSPTAGVTIGAGGVVYGTTQVGGATYGIVFQLAPPASAGGAWTESIIYKFTGTNGDSGPCTSLTLGKGGALYGTTLGGTAFGLQPPASPGGQWTETFALGLEGNGCGGLTPGSNGVLYGTATWSLASEAFVVTP